jgi:hypothetical protein
VNALIGGGVTRSHDSPARDARRRPGVSGLLIRAAEKLLLRSWPGDGVGRLDDPHDSRHRFSNEVARSAETIAAGPPLATAPERFTH